MADPRVSKLAQVLVNYSMSIKSGDELLISSTPLANDLSLAIYKEALSAGAHVFYSGLLPGAKEAYYKLASDAQLDHVSPYLQFISEHFDASLYIGADFNTRELAGANPERQGRLRKAQAELFKIEMERSARGELKWCYTIFPTNASAQEADMSLSEYEDFVYSAGLLDLEDPIAAWKEEAERQRRLMDWLAGKDEIELKGSEIDLRFSIKDRTFQGAAGRENFPDGEIFTSPVEDSVNGWVRFGYPAIYGGQEVIDIELWFEEGKIVKESAQKGQDILTALLDTDEGSRYLGEWGIGTNYGIQRFTKNMLFDEKIGGTIHLAMGAGFPECGGENLSGLHWDMLCNMAESEVHVDGELFYKNGKFVV
jgi:aminopeptidase